MTATTTIVQLTDTHIGPPGSLPYGVDTAANLRRVMHSVAQMSPAPDVVLLTGDLSDSGEPESYDHLRQLIDEGLEPLGCPVLSVIGNHDLRPSFRRHFLGERDLGHDLPYYYVHDLDSVRIVMCDSHVEGEVTGWLGPDQLAWLDEQLATAGDRSVVVAMHHPSVPRGVPKAHDHLLVDRDALAAVISLHDVEVVLCGHSHVSTAASFAGTLHVAAPSTAFLMDPFSYRGSARLDTIGYSICTVRDGRAIVNPFVLEPEGAAPR
ncbi:MAG: phosphodiesterase [Acidimicrobiales bacterium]